MASKPAGCRGCPLERLGSGFVPREDGGSSTGVLVVAEAPGADEAREGVPLVGAAGKTWDRLVGRTIDPVHMRPFVRADFCLDNVLHCQPPSNVLVGASYERAATEHCRPNLENTLQRVRPKAILTLGNTPLRWFTGQWGVEQLRGYVFETSYGPVIPTYHPSYIMRGNWHLSRVVQLDLLRAVQVAREGTAKFHVEKAYELSPSAQELERFLVEWRAAGRPPMAFDIETPHAGDAADAEGMTFEDDASYTILMISLSWQPYKAISVPWIEPFRSMIIKMFSEQADFLVWNAKFDVPRLQAGGVSFKGRVVDVMLAWHWLEPSLPMGLKYVATFFCPDMQAWKLDMHKNFAWYNCADSDVLLRVFKEIHLRLSEEGRWKTFERHFLDYGQVLQRMSERGVTVDEEARKEAQDRFKLRFDSTVEKAAAGAPKSLGVLNPKRGYARTPKDTTGMVQIEVELSAEEQAKLKKEEERARQKAIKEAEKQARKAQREEARRAKALGKANAKRKARKGGLK